MANRKPIRVLVADDHQAMRKAICKLLSQKRDIEVIGESRDGQEALEMVAALHPDVLLLDMEMPKKDGVDVAREMRTSKCPTRILVLSGYDDRSYIRLVLEQGVYGYLTKDEAPGKVIEAIRQVAHGSWVGAPPLSGFSSLPA